MYGGEGDIVSPPVFLAATAALAGERVRLEGPEGRHAATVRRLRAGERVDVTDGLGLLVECVVVSVVGKDVVELEVVGRRSAAAPRPRLVVVQALPKGDRGELAVETMTEVGVDEIVPWAAARCVTQWRGDRGGKALARWRSTAREAGKQARRSWLPEVADLATTAEVASRLAGAACAVVLHEEATTPLTGLKVPVEGEVVVVVGPEGGITPEELAAFERSGGVPALLGPTVLRTSTAGVAAAAVLLAATGRW
jgi:16S rRNA (uracil1498-N3)-methyltransferase